MDKKEVQSKELSPQERAEEFVLKYEALCKEYNMQIVVNPAFKARDDGTFSVVLQTSVGEMPKNESKDA
jgi:hypothetical protein